MRNRDKLSLDGFTLILGLLIAIGAQGQTAVEDPKVSAGADDHSAPLGHVALAGSEELPAASAPPISAPATVAAPLTGPQVYRAVCIACHAAPGVGGAPALGDRDAWAARIAQGTDTLIAHALQGFSGSTGIMPKKGGSIDLSDEEVVAAVEYLVQQVAQ